MLKALAQKHQITLLSFSETGSVEGSGPLNEFCRVLPAVQVPAWSNGIRLRKMLTTPLPDMAFRLFNDDFSAALAKALAETFYDAVQVEGIELAVYIDVIRSCSPDSRIILDCHNAETELQRRARKADLYQPLRWPVAIYSSLQIGRLARFERRAMMTADGIIAVSEADRAQLRQLLAVKGKEVIVIPNTIDITDYAEPPQITELERYDLVFTGKMDYRPNIDGVLWFAEAIWPQILAQRPRATWAIVGQRPHPRLNPLRQMEGITITGRVPHIQPYLCSASIYVAPLRIGSGTRLKILEALAAGKPVVSTTVGAEGLATTNGENIIIADEPGEWASAILNLLDQPDQQAALGSAARTFAARYDWRHIVPTLSAIYPD